MAPSLVVIALGLDPTRTLVVSQVVLSFGLPFAVIPLVMFTPRKDIMGVLVNRPLTNVLGVVAAALIVALNLYLLYQTFLEGDAMFHHLLVPLDGSRMSESSSPAAARLARRAGAMLTLVHVIEKHAPAAVHTSATS